MSDVITVYMVVQNCAAGTFAGFDEEFAYDKLEVMRNNKRQEELVYSPEEDEYYQLDDEDDVDLWLDEDDSWLDDGEEEEEDVMEIVCADIPIKTIVKHIMDDKHKRDILLREVNRRLKAERAV